MDVTPTSGVPLGLDCTLSVVIPLWNCHAFASQFGQALSEVKPTYLGTSVELILVDDASTDGSLDAFASVVPKSLSLKTISVNCRSGPGNARNLGLDVADGDFISFWDADDTPYMERYQALAFRMNSSQARRPIGCVGYSIVTPQTGETIESVIPGSSESVAEALRLRAAVWRFVFRRDFLLKSGLEFPPIYYGEDLLFLLDCSANAKESLVAERGIGYTYRWRRGDSLSSSPTNDVQALMHALAERSSLAEFQGVRWLIAQWYVRIWSRRRGVSQPGTYPELWGVARQLIESRQFRPFWDSLRLAKRQSLT